MNQEIRIDKDKIYLSKWLIGHLCRSSITGKYLFAADVDYQSPLKPSELRVIADKLDEMNGERL